MTDYRAAGSSGVAERKTSRARLQATAQSLPGRGIRAIEAWHHELRVRLHKMYTNHDIARNTGLMRDARIPDCAASAVQAAGRIVWDRRNDSTAPFRRRLKRYPEMGRAASAAS